MLGMGHVFVYSNGALQRSDNDLKHCEPVTGLYASAHGKLRPITSRNVETHLIASLRKFLNGLVVVRFEFLLFSAET